MLTWKFKGFTLIPSKRLIIPVVGNNWFCMHAIVMRLRTTVYGDYFEVVYNFSTDDVHSMDIALKCDMLCGNVSLTYGDEFTDVTEYKQIVTFNVDAPAVVKHIGYGNIELINQQVTIDMMVSGLAFN